MKSTSSQPEINIEDLKINDIIVWKTRQGWSARGKLVEIDLAKKVLSVAKAVTLNEHSKYKTRAYPVPIAAVLKVNPTKDEVSNHE